jgi:accessory gene regulator B
MYYNLWVILLLIIDTICGDLIRRISTSSNINKVDMPKIEYGLKVLFTNTAKFLSLMTAAYILGILRYTLIFFICFSAIRMFAFGIHAKTSLNCTLSNFIIFIGTAFLSTKISVNNFLYLGMFAISFMLFILYAPSDTEARPIVSKRLRKKLKIKTIVVVSILMIIGLIVHNPIYKSIIVFATITEGLCITPLLYKIFGKGYKNYENINLQGIKN